MSGSFISGEEEEEEETLFVIINSGMLPVKAIAHLRWLPQKKNRKNIHVNWGLVSAVVFPSSS